MAMALSASFEQGQEQFEIDQQLQFQRLEKEAEGTHPAIRSRDEAGDYTEDEEEEAALAAAIYASLGQCVTNSILVSVCVSNLTPACFQHYFKGLMFLIASLYYLEKVGCFSESVT